MASDTKGLGRRTLALARHPRTRKTAIWLVSIVVAFGVLLGLVAPPLIRSKLASALSDTLRRPVSIEKISINPYALTLAVRGFLIKERQGDTPFVYFDELFVNLEMQSLFRLAPVIKELRLVKPYVGLVRNEDLKYNFQDLLDRPSDSDPKGGPPPRFALNNIEIIDGSIDFDDRPEKTKHTIAQLKIGVPFISSLPSDVDIKVRPEFSAVVNGAPFHLAGDTVPFKESRESTIGLDVEKLEIAKYLEYSPVPLNFTVPSGHLAGKIQASFRTAKNTPAVLSITGNLGLKELEMRQIGGGPLIKSPSFEVLIDAIEVFANKTTLKSIKSEGLELHINRGSDGKINLANLVGAASEPKTPPPPAQPQPDGKRFLYAVEEVAVTSATLHFTDEKLKQPYRTRLNNVTIKATDLTNEAGRKANVEFSFESENKEKFSHGGALQLAPLIAEGKLDIEGLRPGALRPYYEDAVAAEIKEGFFDMSTKYRFAAADGQSEINLSELSANLRSVRLDLPGQPEPLWRIGSLAIKDSEIDVAKKLIVIGALQGKEGTGYIQRGRDGTVNVARIVRARTATAGAEPAPAPPAKPSEGGWRIDAKQLQLDGFKINVDDRGNPTPAKISLFEISLRGENFSTAKNQRGKATLRARVNEKGAIRLAGTATANPVEAKFTIDAQDVDIVPLQPYLDNQVNFTLTGGRVGTKGEFSFDARGTGPAKMNYRGGVQVADFAAVEKTGERDLLRWKNLGLDALQFDLRPFQLRIGEITLADFFSRLILRADGKLNLQTLTVQNEGNTDGVSSHEKAVEPAPEPGAGETAQPKAVSIGKINLKEGNIQFSDFFVKPNYSANLTGVQGTISELKAEAPGDIDIQARLDNEAPVEIKGKINPLGKDLFIDINADAKGIELSPLTPYSAKYVGYGIERGKLSFNVKYKLEDRKLSAQNKIILNQLTFGERIESPTATKLPVLLAVALMKDRNGVIDIDLPISGSLDDPQFSVGGIVLRIIFNVITRAVTAPFTLLASAFGGGDTSGEELSYIEFEGGRSRLSDSARDKIATLAKALHNRPALKLEIIGRSDPATDLEGLKRAGIERKVKAQKLKELGRRGEAPRAVDDVQVAAEEYPRFLKAAYGEETFPKPRNVIGLAQDLPVAEMEKLMMQHAKVSDDEMRELANRRADAVRDAILATGQAGAERLLIVAAKPMSTEDRSKLKGKPSRVDFAMR